jgi:hypothetical protein
MTPPSAPLVIATEWFGRPRAMLLASPQDYDQECRVTLLLLGNGAVLAHRFRRPLAAEVKSREVV